MKLGVDPLQMHELLRDKKGKRKKEKKCERKKRIKCLKS